MIECINNLKYCFYCYVFLMKNLEEGVSRYLETLPLVEVEKKLSSAEIMDLEIAELRKRLGEC